MSMGPYSNSPNFRVITSSSSNTLPVNPMNTGCTTTIQTAPGLGYEIGTNTPVLPQCPMHVTEDSNIEYIDGKVVSYCSYCGDRIEIKRLPGGLSMVRARDLAAVLVEKAHDDALTSEDFGELSALAALVSDEQAALAEVASLLKMVREALGV